MKTAKESRMLLVCQPRLLSECVKLVLAHSFFLILQWEVRGACPEADKLRSRFSEYDGQISALLSERSQALTDLRLGAYCSKCDRTRSEFAAQGESFEAHLADVNAQAIPASPEMLQGKAKEFDEAIKGIEQQKASTQVEIRQALAACEEQQKLGDLFGAQKRQQSRDDLANSTANLGQAFIKGLKAGEDRANAQTSPFPNQPYTQPYGAGSYSAGANTPTGEQIAAAAKYAASEADRAVNDDSVELGPTLALFQDARAAVETAQAGARTGELAAQAVAGKGADPNPDDVSVLLGLLPSVPGAAGDRIKRFTDYAANDVVGGLLMGQGSGYQDGGKNWLTDNPVAGILRDDTPPEWDPFTPGGRMDTFANRTQQTAFELLLNQDVRKPEPLVTPDPGPASPSNPSENPSPAPGFKRNPTPAANPAGKAPPVMSTPGWWAPRLRDWAKTRVPTAAAYSPCPSGLWLHDGSKWLRVETPPAGTSVEIAEGVIWRWDGSKWVDAAGRPALPSPRETPPAHAPRSHP